MTLGQFSVLVEAPRRWVQNAFRVLEIDGGYTLENGRRLAFARLLKGAAGLPLTQGYPLADDALAGWPDARTWTLEHGPAAVVVDLERFLSDFHARLSLARTWYAEKKRGRPRRWKDDGLALAQHHGVDVSLLEVQLRRSPAERLSQVEEAARFLRSARVGDGA